MHISILITDLAIMLITAGLVTILFKKIRQPVVLGYILAGFLLSSYFPIMPAISDVESIGTLSEIGMIFLMFHHGLEFSFRKLARVGSTAIITAMVEVIGMLLAGYATGRLLGFGTMDSIFLGGMLSMSSPTIIVKVIDELKLKGQKFTELVAGTLMVEDIAGIFMIVILSAISVSRNVSGSEVISNIAVLALYLVIWRVLGIYFLPTFLNRTIKLMTDEMLTIVSVGVCFGMVILAVALGFSSALGAFLAGSLLAGTIHVERIESLTRGTKDLFGAIYFIAVGMMVEPDVLWENTVPVIVIAVVAIVGQFALSTLGMLLSGQTVENAFKCGFTLAQIGEFAFIIASLGVSLGVIDATLYPIVVFVSAATTFITPYFIKNAPAFIAFIEKHLPAGLAQKLSRYTSDDQQEAEQDNDWYLYLKSYFRKLAIFGGIMLAIALLGSNLAETVFASHLDKEAAGIAACVLIYAAMAIFVVPLMDMHNSFYTTLWLRKRSFRLPLMALNFIKVAAVAVIAMVPLRALFGVGTLWLFIIVVAVMIVISGSHGLTGWYLQLETRFLINFNERIIRDEEASAGKQTWLYDKLRIISFKAAEGAPYVGRMIMDLNWGRGIGVYVVKIRRGSHTYVLPRETAVLHAGDKVYVIGEERSIQNFYQIIGENPQRKVRTLREFMESGYADTEKALSVCALKVTGQEEFCGKAIRNSNILRDWGCMVLGLQRNGLPVIMPSASMIISKGDIMWVIGSNNQAGRLASEYSEYPGESGKEGPA